MALDPLEEEVGGSAFFEIRDAVERALAGTGATAAFSGLPAASAEDQEQTLGAIRRLTPIGLALVLLLFGIVERRPGGLLSVAAVLVLSIGAALGAVGLLTGKLTVMETFFGVTVFGLGIDFAVHLFTRQREELARGLPFERALRRTVAGAGRGVVAGCVTTAGAFLVASAAPDPVALHLGLSGGLGLLFCLPLTLLILPSVWVLRERRRHDAATRIEAIAAAGAAAASSTTAADRDSANGEDESRPAIRERGGAPSPVPAPGLPFLVRWATERPVRCLVVCAAVLAAALAGLPRLQVETRLERIMNRGIPALAAVDRIQEILGTNGAPWILAADDLEESREFARRLEGHPLFSGTLGLGAILPADLAERAAVLEGFSQSKDTELGAAAAGSAQGRSAETGGAEGGSAPAFDALLPARPVPAAASAPGGAVDLAVAALRRAAAAGPPALDSLPPALREKFIAPTGEFLVYAYPGDSKADGALARRQRLAVQAIDPGATGLLAVVEGTMIGERPWIPWIALSILGFVLLVLCVDFRRPAPVLLALVPVLAAVPFTLGVLCWIGIPFNVMTWVVLPLILGLGIDDGIHVVHRILDDPSQSIRSGALSVGRAIAMTTLTTTASFSVLLFTDHLGLETMAAVMLVGLAGVPAGLGDGAARGRRPPARKAVASSVCPSRFTRESSPSAAAGSLGKAVLPGLRDASPRGLRLRPPRIRRDETGRLSRHEVR